MDAQVQPARATGLENLTKRVFMKDYRVLEKYFHPFLHRRRLFYSALVGGINYSGWPVPLSERTGEVVSNSPFSYPPRVGGWRWWCEQCGDGGNGDNVTISSSLGTSGCKWKSTVSAHDLFWCCQFLIRVKAIFVAFWGESQTQLPLNASGFANLIDFGCHVVVSSNVNWTDSMVLQEKLAY